MSNTIRSIVLAFALLPLVALGQVDSTGTLVLDDVDRYYPRENLVVMATTDGYLDAPDGFESSYIPRGFSGFVYYDRPFGKSGISMAIGAGISNQNIHSNSTWVVDDADENWELFEYENPDDFTINKFSTTYAEVPLELRWITNGNPKFRLVAGFRAGYLLQAKTKQVIDGEKVKYYDYDGIERFRYGVSGRIGIGVFAITGYYQLSPLFEGEGPGGEVVPWSVGLALCLF